MGVLKALDNSKVNQKTSDAKSKSASDERDELGILFIGFGWGVPIFTLIVVIGILFTPTCSPLSSAVSFLGIAAGCSVFGAAIGFLFGIPRTQKDKSASSGGSTDANGIQPNGFYNDNTNLEEISDWLTKIILGLTLVELKPILEHINYAAENFSKALGGKCCSTCTEDYYAFAYATLVSYFFIGGGLSYLWTRSNLLSILEARRLERLRKQNQQLSARNESLYNKLSEVSRVFNKGPEVTPTVSSLPLTDDAETENVDNEKSKKFKSETMTLYRKREVKHSDDPQSERWGGISFKDNIKLSAKYNPNEGNAGFYGVDLIVESISSDQPLGNEVAFFLHDTFPHEIEFVKAVDDKATLTIRAFEAFVVGARTESGVELELNLNDVKGFPPDFYY